ncbi:MAG: hypothetical protein LBM09_02875 [Candidatus Nomurabacteria bacterium]|nr:hypothetical protein [Candidatus Nomurabacteria bacterium]
MANPIDDKIAFSEILSAFLFKICNSPIEIIPQEAIINEPTNGENPNRLINIKRSIPTP